MRERAAAPDADALAGLPQRRVCLPVLLLQRSQLLPLLVFLLVPLLRHACVSYQAISELLSSRKQGSARLATLGAGKCNSALSS